MIVIASGPPVANISALAGHRRFLEMLPQIRHQARTAFHAEKPEAKEDLVADVIASAYVAFVRLVERGQMDRAFPSTLAQYAIRQTRSGRCVGRRLNLQDVSSRRAQIAKHITMERLDRLDPAQGEWRHILVEDKHAGPAETAIARLDVAAWLRLLTARERSVAQALALGETTGEVAHMLGVTPGRISQLRDQLERSWCLFQNESAPT
jgi:DNA-binding NarL/FixJ family response regulator